ncbi:MAG: NAD-dependent epimerase/dehydratase family protein [Flavobacteriales bacterium]|nr:NAD-dependent epimerase/dehydratase family protein [Flavobacteriales bacterium]
MANILITGGAGFIPGSLGTKLAFNSQDQIFAFDNFVTGDRAKIPKSNYPNTHFIEGDVNVWNDIEGVFKEYNVHYVFHFAALVGVKRTLENPVSVLRDIEGIKNVLELSRIFGVKRIFYSSSSEVYGEPVHIPQNEHTTPLNSRLPYAIVKNAGEAFLRSYHKEYGLDYTIFRFFNTYGPQQSDDFVISRFIRAALINKDIAVYGDGSQTRTFCYIDDNVDLCERSLRSNLFVNDVVNVGSEVETTILDLAKLIIEITNSSSKIIHMPALEEGDMTRRKPDNSKMKTALGRDLISLSDGLSKVIKVFTK